MQAYAIYRLPHEDHATIIRQKAGDPVELNSLTELNGKKGFVVAPFEVKGDQPVVLIQGEPERVSLDNKNGFLDNKNGFLDKKDIVFDNKNIRTYFFSTTCSAAFFVLLIFLSKTYLCSSVLFI